MTQSALDELNYDAWREIIDETFQQTASSSLTLKRPATTQSVDPEFGHYVGSPDGQTYQLHYTQYSSSSLKEKGPERSDYLTETSMTVHVSQLEVLRTIPDGKIRREQDLIIINAVEHTIEAIIPIGQQHGKSTVLKLKLTARRPSEQDQGDYGAGL